MGLIKQGAVLGETEEVTNSAKCSPPAVAYQLMQMPCALLLVQSVRRPNTLIFFNVEKGGKESVGVVVCFFFVLLAYFDRVHISIASCRLGPFVSVCALVPRT